MYDNKTILLYGAGKEAHSTVAFLQERYPSATLMFTTDTGEQELSGAQYIALDDIEIFSIDIIIKSPGVSRYKPLVKRALDAGVIVTSNLNIWAEHYRTNKKIIGITGTKGKSTTSTLVYLMLKNSGVDAILAGNVGVAALDIKDQGEVIIFELSSYQTADLNFSPEIAALTNLYPEHVDWHGSVEQYYQDKLHLFSGIDPIWIGLSQQALSHPLVQAAYRDGMSILSALDASQLPSLSEGIAHSRLKGAHNVENCILASKIALAAGATWDGVLAGVAEFMPLPHRLEEFSAGDVMFVDDSISTTPEATKAALAAYKGKRIALLAGGHEREQDYTELVGMLHGFGVTTLGCLPVTGERLSNAARALAETLDVHDFVNLEEAMQTLAPLKANFDVLILSPGAPSYNQFKNFQERGDAFKALAKALFH